MSVSPASSTPVVLDTSTSGCQTGPVENEIGSRTSWAASLAPLPGYTADRVLAGGRATGRDRQLDREGPIRVEERDLRVGAGWIELRLLRRGHGPPLHDDLTRRGRRALARLPGLGEATEGHVDARGLSGERRAGADVGGRIEAGAGDGERLAGGRDAGGLRHRDLGRGHLRAGGRHRRGADAEGRRGDAEHEGQHRRDGAPAGRSGGRLEPLRVVGHQVAPSWAPRARRLRRWGRVVRGHRWRR